MNAQAPILIVDSDKVLLETLARYLKSEGYTVQAANSLKEALHLLNQSPYSLLVSDVDLPDASGFELLRTVIDSHPEVVTVLMTGYGTIESAVDAIKLGAYDYLTKPIMNDEFKLTVERALQQQALLAENHSLKTQLTSRYELSNVVGQDYKMSKVFDLVRTVSDSKVNVLLTGQSGTGKSLIARAIHQLGPRSTEPFIEVSCGAIPETLLESELFGHVQGSFTGAIKDKEGKFKAAHGGTIFLDEIATASAALQVKLLRVLQDRQFEPVGSNETIHCDVRVLFATNADLIKEVQQGRFRQDLYYRINVVNIELPQLSQRLSDIPLLSKHFVNKYNHEFGKNISSISPEALQLLQNYDWPGNVRELENVIERAIVFTRGSTVGLSELPPHLLAQDPSKNNEYAYAPQSLQDALAGPEKQIILSALKAHHWNRQATADALKINRTTLYKKMKHYRLDAATIHQHT